MCRWATGTVSTFTDPSIWYPENITAGPDGNVWFTNENHLIGRIAPDGTVSNFTDPSISGPRGITSGPDGNLWFTNYSNSSIGRITPEGVVSNFADPSISGPQRITAGPDGNLWFTNYRSIGRITPDGTISNFTGTGISNPLGITAGPDGNLWFTNQNNNSIGRITPAGVVSNFTGTGISLPAGITSGPDSNLWFTNYSNSSIGRITPEGVVSNFTDPSISGPQGITAGPDGNLWFTSQGSSSIGRINLPQPEPPFAPDAPSVQVVGDDIVVSWNAPDDGGSAITGYRVQVLPTREVYEVTNSTSITFDDLTPGNAYKFRVKAVNAVGYGPFSDKSVPLKVPFQGNPPASPDAPSVQVVGDDIVVSWNAPDDGGSAITGYRVQVLPTREVYEVTNSTSITFDDLTPGNAYKFRVKAVNAVGNGLFSDKSVPLKVPFP